MLYFMLQWTVREKEISNDCPLHSHISTQPWAPQSQALCTTVKTDHGSYVLDGEEHVHITDNNMAGEKTWTLRGGKKKKKNEHSSTRG